MNGLFLPSRAMTTISDFLRIEYLTTATMEPGLGDFSDGRLMIRRTPRDSPDMPFAQSHPLCVLGPSADPVLPAPASLHYKPVVVNVGSLAFVCTYPGASPHKVVRYSACFDLSSFPPRRVAMPKDEVMSCFLNALFQSAYVVLPRSGYLLASCRTADLNNDFARGWLVLILDPRAMRIVKTLRLAIHHNYFNEPVPHLLPGDEDHVYLFCTTCTVSALCVRLDTGEITLSGWINCEHDDGPYSETILAVPLPNRRWMAIDSLARTSLLRLGEGLEGMVHTDFRDLPRRIGPIATVSDAWPLGDGRILLAGGEDSRTLVLVRPDVEVEGCRARRAMQGAPEGNEQAATPACQLRVLHYLRAECFQEGGPSKVNDSWCSFAPTWVRVDGDDARVAMITHYGFSVEIRIHKDRIISCEAFRGSLLQAGTVPPPGLEACWTLVRRQQEERVAGGARKS